MTTDFQQLDEARAEYKLLTSELPTLAVEKAEAEAAYQKAKAIRTLELKAEGLPATLIQLVVKGDEAVNGLLLKRDSTAAIYEATQKAVDTYKLDARLIEARIQRDWNQGGRL